MIYVFALVWPLASVAGFAADNPLLGWWFALLTTLTWSYLLWSACEPHIQRLRERSPNGRL